MKYKVGEKVRVRKDLKEDIRYGSCFFRNYMSNYIGELLTIEHIYDDCYSVEGNSFYWADEMFEDMNKITSLEDLQFADVLTLRNGEKYVYADDYMYGKSEDYYRDCDTVSVWYHKDLTQNEGNTEQDIVKVERMGEVIFERTEEVKEMTVEEISKALGYEVKVVK